MIKTKISNLEFGTLNYFITRAFLVGVTFNALIEALKQNSWIIPLLSFIPGILYILILNYIMNYQPKLNINEKITKLFKNKFSYFLIILLTLFALFLCILNFLDLNNFVKSQFLNKTPMLAISIMFSITAFYILTKGINVISRTGLVLFYINIFLSIVSIIGLIPEFKIDNLKPFLDFSSSGNLGGISTYYAFNITPMFILSIIPKDKIRNSKLKKTLIYSYIFSAITLFFIVIMTVGTFSYELAILYEYPEFNVLKHISFATLNSRLESILVTELILDMVLFNLVTIYFIGNSINHFIKTKKINTIYFVISFIIVIGTFLFSKYNIYLDNLMLNIIPISVIIFTLSISILICVKIKINKKTKC